MSGSIKESAALPSTSARVSLGLAGPAIPAREHLRFQLDHALARDAVHAPMDVRGMMDALRERGLPCVALRSAAADRSVYLRRPDLGRRLDDASRETLRTMAQDTPDVVFLIADGLSALAVDRHALPLMDACLSLWGERPPQLGPVCVVQQGRVAIGDEVGSLLQARMIVVLIGERPGLSAADSLGVYLTWEPRPGRTDAERNCISNVRPEGLHYAEAARRILFYLAEAKKLGGTGVLLKEDAAGDGRRLS